MKEKNAPKKTAEKIERILGGNWLVFISDLFNKNFVFFLSSANKEKKK